MKSIDHDAIVFTSENNMSRDTVPAEYRHCTWYLTPETEIDGFLIVVHHADSGSAELFVHEITGRYQNGTHGADVERYLSALIKCDGCSHVTFNPHGLHLCEAPSWQDHIHLMEQLYKFAFELMKRPCDWE